MGLHFQVCFLGNKNCIGDKTIVNAMRIQIFQFKEANGFLLKKYCWFLKVALYMLWSSQKYPGIKAVKNSMGIQRNHWLKLKKSINRYFFKGFTLRTQNFCHQVPCTLNNAINTICLLVTSFCSEDFATLIMRKKFYSDSDYLSLEYVVAYL